MRTCHCGYPVWGTDKKTGIGYCKMHQSMRTDLDRRTSAQKIMDKIKNNTGELGVVDPKEESELDKWFLKIAKEIAKKPYCLNCGEYIQEKYYRHATAHLLPKKTFISVATHPLNYVIVGAGCGCHNETHRWDLMQKMNCFPLILERLVMIEPDIAEGERKNLPQFLLDYIENNNPFIEEPEDLSLEDKKREKRYWDTVNKENND